MIRKFDLTLEPIEGAHHLTLLPPTSLRVYGSSVGEMLSVVLHDRDGDRQVIGGTRLTFEQVVELHDGLTKYLRLAAVERGYLRGYEQGCNEGRGGA